MILFLVVLVVHDVVVVSYDPPKIQLKHQLYNWMGRFLRHHSSFNKHSKLEDDCLNSMIPTYNMCLCCCGNN